MKRIVPVTDNEDLLLEIFCTNSQILVNLFNKGIFKKSHKLNDHLWLVRIEFDKYDEVMKDLYGSEFKIVLTRFTSGSQYISSDRIDDNLGSNITG